MFTEFMEQWPSGQDADLSNERSQIQNHKVTENCAQLITSAFILQGSIYEYQEFLGLGG